MARGRWALQLCAALAVHLGMTRRFSSPQLYTPFKTKYGRVLIPFERGRLRLYLDTAEQKDWAKYMPLGIFHGITTNPELCRRAGVKVSVPRMRQLSRRALESGAQEVMVQAWGGTVDDYEATGAAVGVQVPTISEPYRCRAIAWDTVEDSWDLRDRVIIKLPLCRPGIEAAARLRRFGFRTCMTACYSPHQVILSMGVGAEFVAPYLGRMGDERGEGPALEAVKTMQKMAQNLRWQGDQANPEGQLNLAVGSKWNHTHILVASIRHPRQLAELAAEGCDTFTVSPAIAEMMCSEQLSEEAALNFEKAVKES